MVNRSLQFCEKAARVLYENAVPEDSGVKADLDVDYVYDIRSGVPIRISASYVETIEGTIKNTGKGDSAIKILEHSGCTKIFTDTDAISGKKSLSLWRVI